MKTIRLAFPALAFVCVMPGHAQVPIAKVSVSGSHACAVTNAGGVKCWGLIGNRSLVPIDVAGLESGVADVASGDAYSCALTTSGGVKCWGSNFQGQLGNGQSGNALPSVMTPAYVTGLAEGVVGIAAGYSTACALMASGGVKCWGSGPLGDGTRFQASTPVDVVGLGDRAVAVATDTTNTCVLTRSGGVKCWGLDVTTIEPMTTIATDIPGMTSGIAAISPRCALTTSGELKCWRAELYPMDLTSFQNGVASLGGRRCVVMKDGAAKCWGPNFWGGTGDGTRVDRRVPVDVSGLTRGVAQISSWNDNTCAVSDAQEIWCWGYNEVGTVGDGTRQARLTPTPVSGLKSRIVASSPGPVSGLWWNAAESGWGIHLTHRNRSIFAAWYTYDGAGNPKWYVASNCQTLQSFDNCQGPLYEVAGPRFFGAPFDSAAVRAVQVGTIDLSFSAPNAGLLRYTVGGQSRTLAIARQTFQTGFSRPAVNYTDLWWNPAQSGWGLAITHQYGVMFLAWFVYDDAGRPVWYVASSCATTASEGCTGTLYRTTGPSFGPSFDPAQVMAIPVGAVSLDFSDPNNGNLSYTVEGVSSTVAITRQQF